MEFWDTFWATMWGALGGAVIGAAAAWLFSLDLARRDRESRSREDAERREIDAQQRYRDEIDLRLTRIVEALYAFADELAQTPRWGFTRSINEEPPPPRKRARAETLAAISAASALSKDRDHEVLIALQRFVVSLPETHHSVPEVVSMVDALVAWKRWADDDYDWLLVTISDAAERTREQEPVEE